MCRYCECDDFICQLCAATGCAIPTCRGYLRARWVEGVGNVCALHDDTAADQERQRRQEQR